MKNKAKRLFAIRRIIGTEKISSQEDLSIRLRRSGYKVTQSTLSRDLKELNVAKAGGKNDTPYYFIPDNTETTEPLVVQKPQHALTDSIKSIDFSANIAVIKTLSGYANAVTVIIDNANSREILGTIAGDDTIFIVMREETSPKELIYELSALFQNIGKLYKG